MNWKKNTLERFNSRLDKAEEQISKLKDKAMGLTQKEHVCTHTHTHTHACTHMHIPSGATSSGITFVLYGSLKEEREGKEQKTCLNKYGKTLQI